MIRYLFFKILSTNTLNIFADDTGHIYYKYCSKYITFYRIMINKGTWLHNNPKQ